MKPVAWTTMPDGDDWQFVSGSDDPNGRLPGKWQPLYTADQLRQAKVEVLREAAARFTGRGSEHTSTAVELELRRMADEIERAGK